MQWVEIAFHKNWFYVCALVFGLMYGFGGLVHIGNILGFGEQAWRESPLSWRVGDIVWGLLDIVAIGGIILRSPIGICAMILAALSQIVLYGLFPGVFALTIEHQATLKGMVYFHLVVLVVVACLIFFAVHKSGS